MRTAVVGHVEWVTFARVDRLPRSGEIVHGTDVFDVPAGGGPVAAEQLRKLAGTCTLFTALGDDHHGRRAKDELEAMGLHVETTFRPTAQRRAFVHLDAAGERAITVLGDRLGPHADDDLTWPELGGVDATFFCAGDDDVLRLARRCDVLVATSRELARLRRVGVQLDAVVGSASDPDERFAAGDIEPRPSLCVWTEGERGGRYETADGSAGRYEAIPLDGPVVDTYGAGDSFVAGLTYALGASMSVDDALELAARCGAASLQGRGPFEGQTRELG